MNTKLIYIILIIIIIQLVIILANFEDIITTLQIYFVFRSPCDGKVFVDDQDYKLYPLFWERAEQYFITKYVKPEDCVIEFGGRYGISSYCIQNNLKNKNAHLVIEPDETIISALYKNIKNNSMKCKVFNGIISKKNKMMIKIKKKAIILRKMSLILHLRLWKLRLSLKF